MRNFRGKSTDTGEWVYGWLVISRERPGRTAHFIIKDDGQCNEPTEWVLVYPHTVGQSMGGYDISGDLIYEGDIVGTGSMITGRTDLGGLRNYNIVVNNARVVWPFSNGITPTIDPTQTGSNVYNYIKFGNVYDTDISTLEFANENAGDELVDKVIQYRAYKSQIGVAKQPIAEDPASFTVSDTTIEDISED